jgi:hypothetical protein
MTDKEVIDAFHLTWGNFPESVLLIRKDRTIIAVNKAGKKIGREVNSKCFGLTSTESHQGCKANEALATQEFTYRKTKGDNGDIIDFWIPVDGKEDCFIHFSIGRRVNYEYG